MCRLTAYLGRDLPLKKLLLDPKYSLYTQSWQPRELSYAKLNADGFGFGWYPPNREPAVYRSQSPIWTDDNLEDLSETLHAPLWLAMVRSATKNYQTSPLNVQPFKYKHLLFLHNGFIKPFSHEIRHAIADRLTPEILENIRGLTDSEYLFALLCGFVAKRPGSLTEVLAELVDWCMQNLGDRQVMLNVIVSDGNQICALRSALNADAPTLYHGEGKVYGFPEGSQLIASEPLTEDGWRKVPPMHLLTLAHEKTTRLTRL